MNNRSLIEVTAVSKTYRRGQLSVPALLNISFEIAPGEFVILVGSSGAGKTTLLNLLAALDWPDQGEIVVGGKNIANLSLGSAASYRRFQVGMIFQAYNLLPQLTAIQNVALPMMAAGRVGMRRAAELLRLVGLSHRTLHRATELSGGEQQRVAIARALVNDPKLVLADEPTGNLDEENAREVVRLLTQSCKERQATLIIATHDIRTFEGANRVFTLRSGLLREELVGSKMEKRQTC
ncbi:MAG TPA: ABC transporter ATP-binding protein [Pyrinomonadaceae bacterium]|nr:ABC transporter ATP-binding protein [Pyrinomonadaceae bacterium]